MTEEKTPKQIVELLDKYIIGQNEAKKSVAVALYNRYRRLQLPKQMQQDITPKNMLMAGPTGVGKTEIARRLAKIVDAPFVKVEATKFTEVGYVGRDVESMVRDLVEEAVRMEEKDQFEHVKMQATKKANNRLVKLIVPGIKRENRENSMQQMMQMLSGNFNMNQPQDNEEVTDDIRNERLSVADQLNKGLLENREVTIEVEQAPKVNPMGDMMGQMGIDMSSLMGDLMPKKTVKRTLKVSDAREVLIQEESKKLINYVQLSVLNKMVLSLSTKLIRSLRVTRRPLVKFLVKVYKEISYQLLRVQLFLRSMVLYLLTISYLLRLVLLLKVSQAI